MRLIAYVRVSTVGQVKDGLGLDVQKRAIRTWAKSAGHKIVEWFSDPGISGSNGLEDRPGLTEAFQQLEASRAEGLVVYALDRLSRKLANQETWIEQQERHGRKVFSVTEPDFGQDEIRVLVRQVLGAIAEYERKVIIRRLQSGRQEKAAQGGYAYGSPRLGYRTVDRELVEDEAEQAAVARIRALKGDGMSLREIAAQLSTEGYQTKRGCTWHPTTVNRVLARYEKAS